MDDWGRLQVEGDALACVTSLVLGRNERYSNYQDCKIGLLNTVNALKRKMTASGQSQQLRANCVVLKSRTGLNYKNDRTSEKAGFSG